MSRLGGPLRAAALTLFLVGLVCAFVLWRLHSFARASSATDHPIALTAGDWALLGGGALVCWCATVALLLLARRRARRSSRDIPRRSRR